MCEIESKSVMMTRRKRATATKARKNVLCVLCVPFFWLRCCLWTMGRPLVLSVFTLSRLFYYHDSFYFYFLPATPNAYTSAAKAHLTFIRFIFVLTSISLFSFILCVPFFCLCLSASTVAFASCRYFVAVAHSLHRSVHFILFFIYRQMNRETHTLSRTHTHSHARNLHVAYGSLAVDRALLCPRMLVFV